MEWRRGIVYEVGTAGNAGKVRVQFPQDDGMITAWLPVAVPFAFGARAWWMPRKGSQVVVLLDRNAEDGVVMGALYSKVDPPPIADNLALHYEFEDGTKLSYDPTAHRLAADVQGDLQASVSGDATLSVTGNLQATAAAISLHGPTTINGTLHITGAVTGDADGTFAGTSVHTHKHGGVQAGGSQTGTPI